MFRAMFSPIISSTWLYLQYLVVFTKVAAGWCLGGSWNCFAFSTSSNPISLGFISPLSSNYEHAFQMPYFLHASSSKPCKHFFSSPLRTHPTNQRNKISEPDTRKMGQSSAKGQFIRSYFYVVSYRLMEEGSDCWDAASSVVNRLQTFRKKNVMPSSFIFQNPSLLQNIGRDYPLSRRHSPQKWSPQANTRENIKHCTCHIFNP